ncbi:hypothetical protein GYMLUDRAFT_838504 [Collybiopsis luxurians FD-317 M1]|uniref:Unplaced genomic scaffold GYMLUscaffold_57, whole genome shotgun sequence n=1 Tax=Collybiopsis luxurians FD-317 M1 TaxID=944289 RepID=A0A0D0BZZ7_9AGAR|nr:hypothetical protein GYMLUDRAFT_838504 [Collybiopsis luxurians FD-317 M1]
MTPPVSTGKREACDNCFRRKVRCDGETTLGNTCSECSKMNLQCTRNIVKKKRGPKLRYPQVPPDSESVESLISAILAAPTAFSVPSSTQAVRGMLVNLALHSRALEKELASLRSINSLPGEPVFVSSTSSALPPSNEDHPSRSDIDVNEALSDRIQGLSLNHYQIRHFGQSSYFTLFQTALDERDTLDAGHSGRIYGSLKKSKLWEMKPWHVAPQHRPMHYEYPPSDLLKSLVALYWEQFHPFHPLLHKPSFEESLAAGLHLHDWAFGSTVLAVCAIASRDSDDPRVLYSDTTSKHSAGWKYLNQIEFVPINAFRVPSVYELQVYPLAVIFMLGTHMTETYWTFIGPGIQLAQMMGVHRSGFGKGRDPKEVELWKRAFWQLVIFDTTSSMSLGRPRLSNINDLDLKLPAMCDDEYWEAPNPVDAFKQPKNTPSKLTFWIHYIKLMEIVGFAQRSIYSARHLDPWGPTTLSDAEWNQKAVLALDSALNEWIDMLPDFLKYNPQQKTTVFAHQSVMLYAKFYSARIQVHKQFMSWPGQKSAQTIHSLAICANAARSCVHLLDDYHQQYKTQFAHLIPPIFSCAMVLSINLWRGIQSKMSLNATREMNDIQKCLDMLALYEDRFELAGQLRDILLPVISASPLPPLEQRPFLKRTRSLYEGNLISTDSGEGGSTSQPNAGSQQIAQSQYNTSIGVSADSANFSLNADWSLPVTSDDLGGMPVHIDIDRDTGTEMGMPFHSTPYGSENTSPNNGVNGMVLRFGPGQVTNGMSSSQDEWSQFMAEVDELLHLVNYPSAGQL